MSPKDIGLVIGIALATVLGGASLKQQSDESGLAVIRDEQTKGDVQRQLDEMKQRLAGYEKARDGDRDLLIRMDERLKNIESAVIGRRKGK